MLGIFGFVEWRPHGEPALVLPDGVRALGSPGTTTFVSSEVLMETTWSSKRPLAGLTVVRLLS